MFPYNQIFFTMKFLITVILFYIVTTSTIHAQNDYSKWSVRLSATNILTNESDPIEGGDLSMGNTFGFEVGVKYFFSKNIATELTIGDSNHNTKIQYNDFDQHRYDIGDVHMVPLNLIFQYHFILNDFRPYFGAGINYSFFYVNENEIDGGVHGGTFDSTFGFALQGGIIYDISNRWFVNFDLKQMFISTDMITYEGSCTTLEKSIQTKTAVPCPDFEVEEVKNKVTINPLSIGLGIGFKF